MTEPPNNWMELVKWVFSGVGATTLAALYRWLYERPKKNLTPHSTSKKESHEPFGPAKHILKQEGLLGPIIETVLEINGETIRPKIEGFAGIESLVTFVEGEENLKECGRINGQAFRFSLFRGSNKTLNDNIEEKITRNRNHLLKNSYTLLLIKAYPFHGFPPGNKHAYIGFSHLIPLNEDGYNKYLRGKTKDHDFSPTLIARVGESARAILLFSIAVDAQSLKEVFPEATFKVTDASFRCETGMIIAKSLAYHMQKMLELYANDANAIEVLTHTDGNVGIVRALRKAKFQKVKTCFKMIDCLTEDRCCIWKATMERAGGPGLASETMNPDPPL